MTDANRSTMVPPFMTAVCPSKSKQLKAMPMQKNSSWKIPFFYNLGLFPCIVCQHKVQSSLQHAIVLCWTT